MNMMKGSKDVLVSKFQVVSHPSIEPRQYVGWEPQNYVVLAVFVCLINPLMGPAALFFSYMAHRSFNQGDIVYTYKWGNYALLISLLSIIASMFFFVSIGFALGAFGRSGTYYW